MRILKQATSLPSLKTIVFGKHIEKKYNVNNKQKMITDQNGDSIVVFTGKPELNVSTTVVRNSEICVYKGQPQFNQSCNAFYGWMTPNHCLYISEDQQVTAERTIFRADLNEYHVYTDHVMSTTEVDLKEAEKDYKRLMREFNHSMICSNDKLKSYCDVHNLKYEDTDCLELFKIVYTHSYYEIKDGKLLELKYTTCSTSDIAYSYEQPTYSLASGIANVTGTGYTAVARSDYRNG